MSWLITGSTAMYHWFPNSRRPKDLDVLSPAKVRTSDSRQLMIDTQWNEAVEKIVAANKDPVFVDANALYTVKISHAHWYVKWEKTIHDIIFLKHEGCELDLHLYHELIPIWEQIHGSKKQVNLLVSNEEFFTESVVRKHDHDHLHQLVAFYERPLYEKIKPDLSMAFCSEEMFLALSPQDQQLVALEEILATAIERSGLTKDSSNVDQLKAVAKAHRRLCTSMTKGWFARFLIMNTYDLLISRKPKWQQHLTQALSQL